MRTITDDERASNLEQILDAFQQRLACACSIPIVLTFPELERGALVRDPARAKGRARRG